MNIYFEILNQNPLFEGIAPEEFTSMLHCLGAYRKTYQKKQTILLAGDAVRCVGLVLAGSVRVLQADEAANEAILAEICAGDIFGEVFACAEVPSSPVSVVAQEDCEILWLDYRKIITTCSKACIFHARLSENLLKTIARKCLFLNKRIEILSKRTTQEKIMAFLRHTSGGRASFTLSLTREEMANYLCVERSAMCAELSKLQKNGRIRYRKNQFELCD